MSSEVGSGHVSIFPVMTGFKSTVTKETKAAGAAGAKTFEGGFKGAGRATGRTLGRDLKAGLSSAAGNLGAEPMRKLTAEVASASTALSKARLKQQDDAGRTRVAEVRLQEAIARGGAESALAVAAAERLASARRAQQISADAVTAATTRLKAAQDAVTAATAATSIAAASASGGLREMVLHLRAGWTDAKAAQSAFTGLSGSVGGFLRAVSDVTGLTHLGRLARLTARQVSTSFTSLATMVGGQLAKGWTASARWIGGVGTTVRTALAPVGRVASAAGAAVASPFIRLGQGVASWMSPVTSQVSAGFRKLAGVVGPAASNMVSTFRSGLSSLGSQAASALQSVVGAAQRAGTAAGQALGAGLRNTATAGVTAAAAGIAVAFGKGFSRLTAIDTARAKLTGLGNDAGTVKTIMGDALTSVRGTSFGLGEAATVAASAVAANIKPGAQLQAHLKNIANNASAAGLSMEEMGSIFNKAATQANGVQNDVIGQLADKGIPIYKALGDQLGVTAGEVFAMASRGEIDFETFSKAAEQAAGTVSQEMGKTVPGAAKNFLAAMGRIGANALEGVYAKIGPLIQAATSALGPIEERAKAFGGVLLKVLGPAMDWLTNLFNQIGSGAGFAGTGLEELSGILGPLGAAFAALGAGGIGGLLAKLGPLNALLPGLSGALGVLGGPLGIAGAALTGFLATGGDADALVSGITGVIDQIVGMLPGLIGAVTAAVPGIVQAIVGAIPELLTAGAGIIQALIDGIVTAVPLLIDGALTLVQGLVEGIVSNLPAIIDAAIELVTSLLDGIIQAVPLLIDGALALVTGLLTAIVSNLPKIIDGGIKLLIALVQGIIGALPMIVQAALDLVMGLLDAITTNLPLIIEGGIQLLLSLVEGLVAALPQLITAAIDLVLQLVTGLLTMLPKLIEAGIQLVVSIITGLVEAIPQILKMMPEIVKAIWEGLAGVDWLDLGIQIVQGIIDGLLSMVGAVGDAIGDIASSAWDSFTSFWDIHSPSRRMYGGGRNIVQGAVNAIDDEGPAFGDSLVGMAKSASARAQRAMDTVSTTVAESVSVSGRRGGSGDTTITQENHFAEMDPAVAVQLAGAELRHTARKAE